MLPPIAAHTKTLVTAPALWFVNRWAVLIGRQCSNFKCRHVLHYSQGTWDDRQCQQRYYVNSCCPLSCHLQLALCPSLITTVLSLSCCLFWNVYCNRAKLVLRLDSTGTACLLAVVGCRMWPCLWMRLDEPESYKQRAPCFDITNNTGTLVLYL